MLRPRRVVEILTLPALIFAAAWLAAWFGQYAGIVLPHGVDFDLWLMDHPILQQLDAELEFGVFTLLATIFVGAVTYGLLRVAPQPAPWWRVHLHLASLLYALGILAAIGYLRCLGNCEGLVLGMFRAWGCAALGGALGNAILVHRHFFHVHAA